MSWGYWFHEGHLSGNLSVIKFGQPVVVSCCGQAVVHFSARIEWHAGAVIAWHRARRDGSLPADLSLVRCPTMPVVNLPEFRAIEGFGGFWISCIACNETFCYWHVLQYIYIYIMLVHCLIAFLYYSIKSAEETDRFQHVVIHHHNHKPPWTSCMSITHKLSWGWVGEYHWCSRPRHVIFSITLVLYICYTYMI